MKASSIEDRWLLIVGLFSSDERDMEGTCEEKKKERRLCEQSEQFNKTLTWCHQHGVY